MTTLELDLAMTKDNVLVVSHDRTLNPDHTRGPDGKFLAREGAAIRTLTFAELQRYDVGRLKPGSAYAASLLEQRPVDGARIPALTELFDLVKRAGAAHVRFNIETKITPTSGTETPDPETFAAALANAVRDAGLTARAASSRSTGARSRRCSASRRDRTRVPHHRCTEPTISGAAAWPLTLARRERHGRPSGAIPSLVAGGRLRGLVAAQSQCKGG